jgi:hypothetical protein
MSECDQQSTAIERRRREIAALEAEIRGGNPDLEGLWPGARRLVG